MLEKFVLKDFHLFPLYTITITNILTTMFLGQITSQTHKNILYNEKITNKYVSKILLSQIISQKLKSTFNDDSITKTKIMTLYTVRDFGKISEGSYQGQYP